MADIVLKWKGEVYRIPDARAFEAGAALEDVVTLAELQSFGARPKFFTLAKGMGVLLRFAGVKVSDREVKAEIDASIARAAAAGLDSDAVKESFAVSAIQQLIAVLFEGAPDDGGDEPGETSAS